jgi:hypothetical protein
MRSVIHVVNVPRYVCRTLIGEHHTHAHRMVAGGTMMAGGVLLSHMAAEPHILLLTLAGDLVGYAIHGMGLVPFLDFLLEELHNEENE